MKISAIYEGKALQFSVDDPVALWRKLGSVEVEHGLLGQSLEAFRSPRGLELGEFRAVDRNAERNGNLPAAHFEKLRQVK